MQRNKRVVTFRFIPELERGRLEEREFGHPNGSFENRTPMRSHSGKHSHWDLSRLSEGKSSRGAIIMQ